MITLTATVSTGTTRGQVTISAPETQFSTLNHFERMDILNISGSQKRSIGYSELFLFSGRCIGYSPSPGSGSYSTGGPDRNLFPVVLLPVKA